MIRTHVRRPAVITAVVGGVFMVALLVSVASAADHQVSIEANTFVPGSLSVDVGDTVTWTNKDEENHSVVGGDVDSPDIGPGGTFSMTFDKPQEFQYSCRFHPYMFGTVIAGKQTGAEAGPEKKGSAAAKAEPVAATPKPAPATPAPIAPVVSRAVPAVGKDLGDGTRLAAFTVVDGVKVFTLRMAPMQLEVSEGVVKQAFAFNGIVPGPVIRVNEGDKVEIDVINDLPIETAVHWHGMILPNKQDGVPHLTQQPITPGQTYTYEWSALAPGTHWYHSHSGRAHIGKGLYGVLEVVPKDGDIEADRDYRIMIGDTDLGFVFNGRSFPSTVALPARVGERVRIRLVGTGEQSHPIHLHGQPFDLIAQDGFRLPAPVRMDTLLVSTGQTFDIVTVPLINPGKWMLHCHIFGHSESDHGMMGLVTILDVAPAPKVAATPKPKPASRVLAASDQVGLVARQGATGTSTRIDLVVLFVALFALAVRMTMRRGGVQREHRT